MALSSTEGPVGVAIASDAMVGICATRRVPRERGSTRSQSCGAETRGRLLFEQALLATDYEGAERVILRMALRTHALVWCHNASRRLAHHKRRAKAMYKGCRL